jgi:hypothetical protein
MQTKKKGTIEKNEAKFLTTGFVPISIDDYVKNHLKINPLEEENDLRENLNTALAAFQRGVNCYCGNDIWVIGSAMSGNSCFTCITGESFPNEDYEIDEALPKNVKS